VLEGTGRGCEDNTNTDIKEMARGGGVLDYVARNTDWCWDFVNTVMNFRVT